MMPLMSMDRQNMIKLAGSKYLLATKYRLLPSPASMIPVELRMAGRK